jgi:hypothetical protein
VSIFPYTAVLPPLLLALFIRPLTFNRYNYLPAGPTALIFAVLAQFHAVIPTVYKYRIVTAYPENGIVLSDKSYTYLLAAQLALSQFPYGLLPAAVGWIVGYSWRGELLPGSNWRIPRWLGADKAEGDRFDGLRRRMEGEVAAQAASASGSDAAAAPRQRQFGAQIFEQLRDRF